MIGLIKVIFRKVGFGKFSLPTKYLWQCTYCKALIRSSIPKHLRKLQFKSYQSFSSDGLIATQPMEEIYGGRPLN